MTPRRIILGLILLTVVTFCLLAAAKLRATPKYDRIQVGMTSEDVESILGTANAGGWDYDEGYVDVTWRVDASGSDGEVLRLYDKTIDRRGPLERLAWLAGWR